MTDTLSSPGSASPISTPPSSGGVSWTLAPDGWVHLMAYGDFAGALRRGDERIPFTQICDREAAEAIARNFVDLQLVDYEHQSIAENETSDTSAAGWIDRVAARDDGLYGHVRWSAKGLADVQGGNYRHLSPVFGDLQDLGSGRMRPRRLLGASLTNKPNFKTLQPVSNRETANPQPTMDYKQQLIQLLGLAATATDEDIQKALKEASDKLKDAGATTPADAADKAVAANKALGDMRGDLAAADLAARGIKPENKAYEPLKKAIVANRAEGLALADAIATAANPGTRYETVTNKEPAKAPGVFVVANKAARQDSEVRAFMAANKCSYEQAFNATRAAKPELFVAD